jgi:hypothetical protein
VTNSSCPKLTTYIDTASSSKYGQRAYGFRTICDGIEIVRGRRFTETNQAVTAQMLALKCVLHEVARVSAHTDLQIKCEFVLPSQHLRARLEMYGNRSVNRQLRIPVLDMRESEEEWKEAYNLYHMFFCGIRLPRDDNERAVMSEIKSDLWKRVHGIMKFTPEETNDPDIHISLPV